MTWKIMQVLIPILIGVTLRSTRILREEDGALLRKFVVRIPIPIMIFLTMYAAPKEALSEMPPMMASFVIISLVMFLVGWVLSRTVSSPARKAAVHASTTFGNYGWMGFGICQVLVGDIGLRLVMFFIMLWWPVFYGLCIPIGLMHSRAAQRPSLRSAFVTAGPILGALLLGLAFNLGNVGIPQGALTVMKPFGDMAIPLILLCAGLVMNISKVPSAFPSALIVTAAKLIVAPLVGWAVASLVTSDPIVRAVIIMEAGMPVASFIPALRENYDLDTDAAGAYIVLSTGLSMVTLPIIAHLVLS